MTTRRQLLASMLGAAVAATPFAALGQSSSIGEIRVDLSPLRRKGWGGAPLRAVESALRNSLQSSFADRLGGGPALVVRVDSIQLSAFTGMSAGSRFRSDAGQSDYMEGELLLVGRGNQIIARKPLLNSMSPVTGGAWWSEASELNRLAQLASSYGYWARRQLG